MFKRLAVAIALGLLVLFYLGLAKQTVAMIERRAERLGELGNDTITNHHDW